MNAERFTPKRREASGRKHPESRLLVKTKFAVMDYHSLTSGGELLRCPSSDPLGRPGLASLKNSYGKLSIFNRFNAKEIGRYSSPSES